MALLLVCRRTVVVAAATVMIPEYRRSPPAMFLIGAWRRVDPFDQRLASCVPLILREPVRFRSTADKSHVDGDAQPSKVNHGGDLNVSSDFFPADTRILTASSLIDEGFPDWVSLLQRLASAGTSASL